MSEATFDFSSFVPGGVPLKRFEAGETVFFQDDDGGYMYIVRSGKVNIIVSGVVLESIGPGGMFGEIAVIDGSPRSATAVAKEATELELIDGQAFALIVERSPSFALKIMRMLAARIRRMNDNFS